MIKYSVKYLILIDGKTVEKEVNNVIRDGVLNDYPGMFYFIDQEDGTRTQLIIKNLGSIVFSSERLELFRQINVAEGRSGESTNNAGKGK